MEVCCWQDVNLRCVHSKCVQATAKDQLFEVTASSWLEDLVFRQQRVSAIKMQCSDGKQVGCCSLHR
jgi:hypothetical protein